MAKEDVGEEALVVLGDLEFCKNCGVIRMAEGRLLADAKCPVCGKIVFEDLV